MHSQQHETRNKPQRPVEGLPWREIEEARGGTGPLATGGALLAAKCEERIITLIDTELHVLRHSTLCYHIKTSTRGGLVPNIEREYTLPPKPPDRP